MPDLIKRARNGFKPTELELEMADEIERLQKALSPFAKIGSISRQTEATGREVICRLWEKSLTHGDFRRAEKAMSAKGQARR